MRVSQKMAENREHRLRRTIIDGSKTLMLDDGDHGIDQGSFVKRNYKNVSLKLGNFLGTPSTKDMGDISGLADRKLSTEMDKYYF